MCVAFCDPVCFCFCFFFVCVVFVSSSLLVSSMIRCVRFLFLFLFFVSSGAWVKSIEFVFDCGLFVGLRLCRRLILFFISGIVVLKQVPFSEFSFLMYF